MRPSFAVCPVTLADYEGPIRQITVADLGHEDPTLLLTNQLRRSPVKLIERYAQRGLWDDAHVLLYEYSPLSQRYPQRGRVRRAGTDQDR